MNKGLNPYKRTPDNHDFMTPEHISGFLRNHRTGTDNRGRQLLARIVALYDNPKVADMACGTCVNWEVFKMMGVQCRYIGIDRTEGMLAEAQQRYGGEIGLFAHHIQNTGLATGCADIVILRHILEHLQEGYEQVIQEALRIASKEVIVVFFLNPSGLEEDQIQESQPDENGCTYFWNTYSWPKFTRFIASLGYKMQMTYIETPGAAHADTIVRIIK